MKESRTAPRISALLLVLSAVSCSQLPELLPPIAPSPSTATTLEADIHEQINRHRVAVGLGRLTVDPLLTRLAREHSQQMASGSIPMGHDGFEQRFEAARMSLGILRMSENVASNYNYPEAAVPTQMVTGWIGSPGHRENLEGPYRITGVGIARSPRGEYFATQLFAAP